MNIPNLTDVMRVIGDAWPFVVSGGFVLAFALMWAVYLMVRQVKERDSEQDQANARPSLENRLTFVVAIIAAGIAAQGMWRFFRDILGFPFELRIVAFAVLELVTFTCALRARRNIREAKTPEDAKAGVDGIAVWVVTALSGTFSATDAEKWPEAVFRLLMPLLAAWLWERGMSIERQRIRKKHNEDSKIHLRITPERVLVWLRVAEPSGRNVSEVDAHRRLTRVAKAAAKVRALRRADARNRRVEAAERRLDRAMRSAVAHAGLAGDPARQQALIAQLGSMYNADALADLTPDAPWKEFANPVQRTWFEVQGLEFTPTRFAPTRPVQVHAEVQDPLCAEVHDEVQNQGATQVREPARPAVEPQREPESANQEVHEPSPANANPAPRTTPKVRRTANLPDRAAKKDAEVQQVLNLINDRGYDAVTLNVVRNELGFTKTTAYNRLIAARELVNRKAAAS